MALPNDYAGQACSLARSLEIIGERWTLLIVRDAFWGVRRFADFIDHCAYRGRSGQQAKSLIRRRCAGRRRASPRIRADRQGHSLWPVVQS